jgi:tripartite motif-containing protein 71
LKWYPLPDGTFIAMWGENGNGENQLNYPTDVAMYCNGWVFVVDSLNYRLQKFFYP